MQKTILNSKDLDDAFIEMCVSGLQYSKNLDDVEVAASGLSKSEVMTAMHTRTLSQAQDVATSSTTKLGTAMKGLGTSIKSFAATHPAIVAVVGAIASAAALSAVIVSIIDANTTSQAELREQAKKSREEAEESKKSLEDLQSKLQENQSRIDELKSKGSITIVEQTEIDKLKDANEELKNQIKYEKQLYSTKKLQSAKDTKAELTSVVAHNNGTPGDTIDSINWAIDILKEKQSELEASQEKRLAKEKELLSQGITDFSKNEDWFNYNNEIKELETSISNLRNSKISAIGSLQEKKLDFVDIDGNALKGYEDIVKRIDDVIDNWHLYYDTTSNKNLLIDSLVRTKDVSQDLALQVVNGLTSEEVEAACDKLDITPYLNEEVTVESVKKAIRKAQEEANRNSIEVKADFKTIVKDLNTSLSALTDNASLLSSINKEISETGRISADNLTKIAEAFPDDKYPEMTKALYDYQLGLISTQELFSILTDCYNTDRDNYLTALKEKAHHSPEVFEKIRKDNAELFKLLSEDYKLDIENWETLAKAKADIDNALMKELAGTWTGYYSMQRDAVTGLYGAINDEYDVYDDSDLITPEMEADRVKQKEIIDKYNAIIQKLNASLDGIVAPDLDFDWQDLSDFDSDSSSSSSAQTFNWIERMLQSIQKAYSKLKTIVSDVTASWSDRNEALVDSLSKVTEEIEAQQSAYDYYMEQFNSSDLSDEYKNLIISGDISIEEIYDDELQDLIDKAQDFYDKAQDCSDAISDLKSEYVDLISQKMNNVQTEFDNKIGEFEHISDMLQSELDLLESKGYMASSDLYKALLSTESNNLSIAKDKLANLQKVFEEAVSSGDIVEGTEKWYELKGEINDAESEIMDMIASIQELGDELRQLEWDAFDKGIEKIDAVVKETDFLKDLFDENELFDDAGNLTDKGLAYQGLMAQNYKIYLDKAKDYSTEIEKINKELAEDPYNQELIDRKNELIEAQREAINSAKDEKDAIEDLISNTYEKYQEHIQKLINDYKKLLQTMKEAHDYEDNIAEKSKKITELRKQLIIAETSDSEGSKKQIQDLKVQLEEAEKDLEDTQYDKMVADTEAILDDLTSELETFFEEKLENISNSIEQAIADTNANADAISNILDGMADEFGIELSEELKGIWNTDEGNVFSNVESILGDIRDYIKNMLDNSNKESDNLNGDGGSGNPDGSTTPPSSKPSTPPSNPSSSSDSSSDSDDEHDWWIHKKYKYPKDKLNIATSVVDRLKYNSFDASFDARAMYWNKMGFSGDYTGSYDQNVKMLKWLKEKGYAKGTRKLSSNMNGFAWTNEHNAAELIRTSDGAILTPVGNGGTIFNNEMTGELWDFAKNPEAFISSYTPKIPDVILAPNKNAGVSYSCGDVSFVLPNVNNYEDFMKQAQKDKRFEKMVQEISFGQSLGNNSFKKFQY